MYINNIDILTDALEMNTTFDVASEDRRSATIKLGQHLQRVETLLTNLREASYTFAESDDEAKIQRIVAMAETMTLNLRDEFNNAHTQWFNMNHANTTINDVSGPGA